MQRRASSPFIVALTALLVAALPARAADYPARPIKLVVPYAAGGPTDVLGRIIEVVSGKTLGCMSQIFAGTAKLLEISRDASLRMR